MIKLRKLQPKDYDDLVLLFTSEVVRKHLGGPIETSAAKENATHVIQKSPDYIHVITFDNRFIGTISFGEHIDSGECELSYQMHPQYWGHGYAQNAIKLALKSIKGKVVAETQVKNKRSRKLLSRLGFREIRTIERFDEEQVYCELEQ